MALDYARLRAVARGEISDRGGRNGVTSPPVTGSVPPVTYAGYAQKTHSYKGYVGYAKKVQGWNEKRDEGISEGSLVGVTSDVTHSLSPSRNVAVQYLSGGPGAHPCSCGAPAQLGVGWSLRGPGGSRWCCVECRPSPEAVMDVAGGLGKPSASREEARADWWRQPVEGWAEGRLEIQNMLTGVTTVVDLRGG